MRHWIWISLYLWMCFCNCHAETANARQLLDDATKALYNKNYADGIAILKKQLSKNPADSKARFLIAKAYAWKGDIPAALEQLNSLIESFPNNTDYLLSKARFLSWQNQNDSAITLLEQARKITPHYKAIWELEVTLRARNDQGNITSSTRELINLYQTRFNDFQFSHYLHTPIDTQQKMLNPDMINVAYLHDQLDNHTPDWHEFILDYIHRKSVFSYQLGMHTVKRFNINDQEIAAGFFLSKFYSTQFYSQFTLSNKQILLARWSLYARLTHPLRAVGTLEADIKHGAYRTLNADVLRVAYSHHWGKLEAKLHGIVNLVNERQFVNPPGYILSASYFFTDRRFIRITQSINTELILTPVRAIRYEVKTFSVDGKLPLNSIIALTMALSHYVQGNAYSRNEIYAGFQYQF